MHPKVFFGADMLFSRIAALVAFSASLIIPFPALSDSCQVCTPILRITPARAECLTSRRDDIATRAEASVLGVVFLNVDECTYDGEEVRGSVAGEMKGEPEKPVEMDRTVVLDAAGIACVVNYLETAASAPDPEVYFDLAATC